MKYKFFNTLGELTAFFLLFLVLSLPMFAFPNFTYIDGNGNEFQVSEKEISYSPMISELSSSGIYSGGEAKTVSLTEQQQKEIQVVFKLMKHPPASELERMRTKGTGLLKFKNKSYIFKMNSPLKNKMEKTLRDCIGN